MKRVFLAIDLPETVRSALAVQQFLLPLPRRVPPDSLHLTLVFLGETPLPVLEAVHEAWEALRLPALRLKIGGFGLFGGERPRLCYAAVAPDPALMVLQAKVETAARRAGAAPEARRFVPHITLGRFAPPGPEARFRLERAVAEGHRFDLPAFEVTEMVLYESHLGRATAQYDPLVRYPLTA
jgi:2'-5' RNA ligase